MENLFMQVFDRRDWIAGQMCQQVDSHAESLACAFLAAGHRPPPWLLPSCAAAPQELNGKPIIPGLLFPGSQMTTPATRRTVFQPPAVPSTSLGNVVVPNGYAGLETICDTVDTNQHEVPQQKQVSVDQEIAEVSAGGNMFSVPQQKQVSVDQEIAEFSAGVNMFSMIKRSRSRQRHIEDCSREMVKAANSGTSDVMQDRMLRSELATAGSNRTTASLSFKPCGDGENNAGTTAISLPGLEKDLYANQDRSTEFVKCSKDDDLGNQGVQLDCSQNQIVSSDNNVKVFNNCSVRSSLGVQVTGSVCHALRETYLSVEPKKLQFDGVESVCMNPASEQMVHQPVCALESANADVAEAHPLNEDPSSNGCPVVNASLSEENDLSQEQNFLARTSLEFNDTDVESPLGPASPVTHHGTHDGKPAYDAVNISASNKRDESVVPEVMSSVSARRTSEMYTAERNNMTSAEDLQQDGTEQDTMEGRVFENSQEQIQNKLEVELMTTAALPCRSGILSHNEENFTQQEGTCLEGQDLNVTTASVADQEMALEMDSILNKHLGDESFDCDDQFDSPIVGKGSFEALHDSQQLGTFGSDPRNRYNTNTARSLHQLLTKPRNCPLSDDLKQYSAGNSHSSMDSFGCGLELDPFYAVASCSSNASIRQENNETPLTPSVEKYSQQKLPSRSGSGSEQMGSIPELEIFRIDEDNSIPEEDEYQDRLPGSVDMNHSCQRPSGRTAPQHITPSLSMRCMDKGNIDLSAESASGELTHHSNIRNDSIKTKYNHPTSFKRKGTVSRSLHDRHRSEAIVDKQGTAEPFNSRKGRHRSEANVVRQSKPSNIVANVTSFVPLVKQKLQSTTVCVKKDVKVKALKAAEAAKRLEEKKQKEQEQRKAAAKAERERLKQEKELKQKLEDEQKKKREVDAAAKKRQREEGEKREMMKKRKCTDEARKQQKQPMDRQRGTKDEKDARQKASDTMEPRKNLVDVGKNQVKSDETTEQALQYKANESKDEKGVAVDDRNASFGSDDKENILNSLEQSYAMSPYKDSDDEDDDDYDEHEQEARRRRKFVPSWARKENLDNILLSNKALDPREIFAQKLSFNIPEVLSAHIPQRILR